MMLTVKYRHISYNHVNCPILFVTQFSSVRYRAAMKMANIDATLDFMFTNPRDSQGASCL